MPRKPTGFSIYDVVVIMKSIMVYFHSLRTTSRITEEKNNSRKEKQHERNRIENDEKIENYYIREDKSDGECNSGREGHLFVTEIRRLQKSVRRNKKYKKKVWGEKAATK